MIPTADHANGRPAASPELVNRVRQLRLGAPSAAPARGGSWLPWVLCGLLAAAWAGVGIKYSKTRGTDDAPPAAATAASGTGSPGKPAAAAGPAAGPGDILLQLKGNLVATLQIAVSPIDVSGRVTEINFKETDPVKKGFVLAKLDATSYQQDYEEAAATLAATEQRLRGQMPASVRPIEKQQAEAELEDAQANLVRAAQDLARLEAQRSNGAVAQQELDKAAADVRSGKARVIKAERALSLLLEGPRKEMLAAMDGDVRAARARRDRAKWRLDNCELKAPIDGTVLSKKADVGSLVNPLAFASSTGGSSASVCEVADLSRMEVEIDVQEREIDKVRPGLACQIAADRNPARVYTGRVDRVMPIADDSKNIIKVRVTVDLPKAEKPGEFLYPKMSVVVTILNRDAK